MKSRNLSAATFIRNTFEGAFCVFESMASFLPFVDDMTILDLGSTDGTLEVLQEIADANPKIRVVEGSFPEQDAYAFAQVAQQCVDLWQHSKGIFWQADEIFHQDLLALMAECFDRGEFDLCFWRYQLKENFQLMRWPPHPVHRVGIRGNYDFLYDGADGMNTQRVWAAKCCSTWDMGWYIKWGSEYLGRYPELPTNEMVMDVSAIGGFIDNIVGKRTLHAPMWHERPNVDGEPLYQWFDREKSNPNWDKPESPFNIPKIMEWHVGRRKYELRASLLDALKSGNTEEIVGL